MTDLSNIGAACPKCSRLVGHTETCPIDYSRVTLPDDYEKPIVPLVGEELGRLRDVHRHVDLVFAAMTAGDYGHMLRVLLRGLRPADRRAHASDLERPAVLDD